MSKEKEREEFLKESEEVLDEEEMKYESESKPKSKSESESESESELEYVKSIKEKKSSSRVVTLMTIVLFCVFAGIGFGIGGISTTGSIISNNSSKSGSNVVNITKANSDFKEVEVDALIENLYSKVNLPAMSSIYGPELDYNGLKVSEMSDDVKNRIAYNGYSAYIESYLFENLEVIPEAAVRYAYDSIFGVGTYKEGQNIRNACGRLAYKYNSDLKRYEIQTPECGGTAMTSILEKAIKAETNGKVLKVVSAVVVESLETGEATLFKSYDDLSNNNALGTVKEIVGEDYTNRVAYSTDTKIYEYIEKNADSLQQYTYTFELDSNGFYKYIGYERTQK